MFFAEQYQLPRIIALETPVVLAACLVASGYVLWMLIQRWTHKRFSLEIEEWALENDMKVAEPSQFAMPEALAELAPLSPAIRQLFTGINFAIVKFCTAQRHKSDSSQFTNWNAMICKITGDWPMTALRPRINPSGLIDLFTTTSFPSMAPPERFVIFGVDSFSARKISQSKLLALLPADIGLILYGSWLIVDFSSRPFDTIELSRCRSLVEQLMQHIP